MIQLSQTEKDNYKTKLGKVLSGEPNGLTLYLDVETYDHGYFLAQGQYWLILFKHTLTVDGPLCQYMKRLNFRIWSLYVS